MEARLETNDDGVTRCWWCGSDPLYVDYHDNEWGRPVDDDVRLFEKLSLEGFQAGLSWLTILKKRDNFRRAFRGFDPRAVARFNRRSVERLLGDAGIVRHRGKIEAVIGNAKRALELADEFGSLAAFVWTYEPEPTAVPPLRSRCPEGDALSKELKRRGWGFVGPTTVYAFMQAMGMVNDHLAGCAAHAQVEKARSRFVRPAARGR